ncbi:MAG: hypothetical protein ABIG44_03380 [Planctomycetota bacterium]
MKTEEAVSQENAAIARLSTCGADLAEALRSVLASIPRAYAGPGDLARYLHIDANVPRRILGALNKGDPLLFVDSLPGYRGIRSFLDSASEHVSDACLSQANEAAQKLEHLLRAQIGGRRNLTALLATVRPDARRNLELQSKRTIFQGMRQWLGYEARLGVTSYFLRPNDASPDKCDIATVFGLNELRRLGIALPLPVLTGYQRTDERETPILDDLRCLNGDPVSAASGHGLISQFSTDPFPPFRQVRQGKKVVFTLPGPDFDLDGSMNYLFGLLLSSDAPRYASEASSEQLLSKLPLVPCESEILEVYLRKDAWPGAQPEVGIFRITPTGPVDDFESRSLDRVTDHESVEYLGWGIHGGIKEMPRYTDAMHHCFRELDWPEDEFRLYRCRVEYPVVFMQIAMRFELPAAPQ